MSSTERLPLLPLDDIVVLPGMAVPVELTDAEARVAVAAATDEPGPTRVLLAPRLDGRYAGIGTVAVLDQVGRLPGGQPGALVRGLSRARIGAGTSGPGGGLWGEGTPLADENVGVRAQELAREYKGLVVALLQQRDAWQLIDGVQRLTDPSAVADTAGYAAYLDAGQKLTLLETADVVLRLELAIRWAREHLEELDVAESIRKDVQEGMDRQQREFLLRQQLAAVRKELRELQGGSGDGGEEPADPRARVEAADLPGHVREAALREVDKLERTSEQSPETGWIQTWLDTVLELPWNDRTEDAYDIAGARAVLDADHAGLDEVKERITEYLAVRKRREERGLGVVGGRRSGAVLALAGPPGVGKTSLGEAGARAMGRKFVRGALGGVRGEAEIRGHRRTYVGALPGRIVRAVSEAGSMNPVVLLDEVDKVGSDYRGDPAAALLEVLDPAQNHTFRDHYLEVDLDLSDVLFLATANVSETIPPALFDRMEVVNLDGYTEDDKVSIARTHLLPRQLERAALESAEVSITDQALRRIAGEYTREAGVRQLERALARVLRKVAVALDSGAEAPVHVDADALVTYLGRPKFTPESAERTSVPGVATGLAVTGAGGDVLFIEATAMDGDPGLTLTGQLGDVMKESVSIALSYLRSRGQAGDLAGKELHAHVPAGGLPKDGPIAGITMTTALASLASGRPVKSSVGMTGEVTLQGKVLPIGGVKQKLLAAHRAGLTDVIIPKRNEPDLDDLPESVRSELRIHPVADVKDVLELALEPAPVSAAA